MCKREQEQDREWSNVVCCPEGALLTGLKADPCVSVCVCEYSHVCGVSLVFQMWMSECVSVCVSTHMCVGFLWGFRCG